ncbi:MAG: 5-formyltetrahydrofolate cyclo-ligase [Rhodospirillales bacterium]|nr:5-formyltetrahydrofolate cyclo-ligase [Rhodospirillales bacterium]
MTADPADIPARKRALRAAAVERRRLAHGAMAEEAARRVRAAFLARLLPPPGTVVSAFWPMGDEIDLRPLLDALHAAGRALALPVVAGRGEPLEFRRWRPGEVLEPGVFGTLHPAAAAPAVRPSLLLVPLLAWDRRGYRLGYGGGYYDRTLARLRADGGGAVTAVGVGYAAQEVEAVPHDGRDERLDVMLTEEGVLEIDGTGS